MRASQGRKKFNFLSYGPLSPLSPAPFEREGGVSENLGAAPNGHRLLLNLGREGEGECREGFFFKKKGEVETGRL